VQHCMSNKGLETIERYLSLVRTCAIPENIQFDPGSVFTGPIGAVFSQAPSVRDRRVADALRVGRVVVVLPHRVTGSAASSEEGA
jgi:hypothetical protein